MKAFDVFNKVWCTSIDVIAGVARVGFRIGEGSIRWAAHMVGLECNQIQRFQDIYESKSDEELIKLYKNGHGPKEAKAACILELKKRGYGGDDK